MPSFRWLPILAILITSVSCRKNETSDSPEAFPVKSESFGQTTSGKEIKTFTLENPNGMVAEVMEYGATLRSLLIPDRDGKLANVTLGFESLADWENQKGYYGSTIGRYGNRIEGGKFSMDGKTYQLAINSTPGGFPTHLHGGPEGFHKKIWKGEPISKNQARGVKFTRVSPDGEEGYPGEVEATVTYWLTDDNELIWEATGTTSDPTPLNLIHHSLWNLSGDPTSSVLDHELQVIADKFLPTTTGLIPTGELAPIVGTPMDFSFLTPLAQASDTDFEPLKISGGLNHTFVLDDNPGVRLAARLRDPKSGRVMEVHTNQPGLHLHLDSGPPNSTTDTKDTSQAGITFESGTFPNALNEPEFPISITLPDETYRHTLVHKFYAK